jgi:PadR family transcriptional regulator PadR
MDLVRELLRGAVPVHVLHHAAEDEVYGAWMSEELTRHGYPISPGTLYPLLHRLQDAGLLTSTERVVDGRVRRVYTTTPTGQEELARLRAVVTELAGEVLHASDTVQEQRVSRHQQPGPEFGHPGGRSST